MRIIYIAEETIPNYTAHSVYLMNICSALGKFHDVTLMIPDKPSRIVAGDIFEYYGVSKNFKIQKLRWSSLKGRAYYFAISACLKAAKQADLIIAYSPKPAFFTTSLTQIPLIYDCHFPVNSKRILNHWLFVKAIRSAKLRKLMVNCQGLRDYFINHYSFVRQKVAVSHNGSTIPEGYSQPKFSNRFSLGYIGNLYSGRGVELMAALAKRYPSVDIHVIGNGDLRQYIDERVDNVFFHGFVQPGKVKSLRNAFDVLLAPYQRELKFQGGRGSSQFMSPMKIFDYMSFGKPIIASKLPAIEEVLVDEKSALLCDPENVDSWQNAVARLLINDQLRVTLGKNAYADFQINYTWEKRAQRMLE